MEMLNRAIADAAEFRDFQRRLTEKAQVRIGTIERAAPAVVADAPKPSKRKGENRQQYRARVYGGA